MTFFYLQDQMPYWILESGLHIITTAQVPGLTTAGIVTVPRMSTIPPAGAG